MEFHFKLVGILLMLLALFHAGFPRYFKWSEQLSSLDLLHRQIMKIHTFFIAFTVFLIGLLCFTSAEQLLDTVLGNKITIGLAVFWTLMLFQQMFGYSGKLWRGKKFETTM